MRVYVPCNNVLSTSLFSLNWDGMMYLRKRVTHIILTSSMSPPSRGR